VRFDGSTWSAADASTTNLLAIDKTWATGRDGKVLRRSASGTWSVICRDASTAVGAAPRTGFRIVQRRAT